MKILSEMKTGELTTHECYDDIDEVHVPVSNHMFFLGDRHGYDKEGVDTFHRDIVNIISRGIFNYTLKEEEMREVLGTFENPNNVIEGLEHVLGNKEMKPRFFPISHMPCEPLIVYSTGDLVCSRKPGEMKKRNVVGKAAKHSRLMGINQHVALMDLIEKARKKW